MRRKTAVAGFSYLAGVFFASFFGISSILFVSGFVLLAFSITYFIRNKKKVLVMTVLLSFVIGMLVYGGFLYFDFMKTLSFDDKTATFNGKITDYDYIGNDLMLVKAKGKIDNKNVVITTFIPYDECEYYDKISFTAKYEKIENNVTFDSFDYNFAEGVFLSAVNASEIEITPVKFSPLRFVRNFSDYVYDEITSSVEGDKGAFLGAMLCGDKSGISDESNASLYRVGIGHIFSVSGTHIVIVFFVFGYIISFFRLSIKTRFALCEAVLILFTLFAGMSASVVRAAIMMTVFNLTTILRRKPDSLTTLAICGIALTLFSPEKIRSASFLLSMSGAFALSVVAPAVMKHIKCKGIIRPFVINFIASLCVWTMSLPIVMMFFNNVSVASPFMNVILVPLCTIALVFTVFGALGGVFGFVNQFALMIAEIFITPVISISTVLSKIELLTLPFGYIAVRIVVIVGLVAVVLITFMKKNTILSVFTAGICVCVFFVTSVFVTFENRNTLEIFNINIKDSYITVLNKNRKSVIIDSDGKNVQACIRLLEYRGIVDVEGLVICDNYYSSSENYKSQFDFCDFDEKNSFRSEFIDTFTFDGVDIEFSEENYIVTYEGVQLTFPYTDDKKPSENGGIYLTEVSDGEIIEKRRFEYAFG